ncbi:MAG: hypothetical protein AAGD06_27895 [Acidobacteriota bacterium]
MRWTHRLAVAALLATLAPRAAAADPPPATPKNPTSVDAEAAEPWTDDELRRRCHDEVLALHRFFQDWFNAEIEASEAGQAEFERVLADDFSYISSSGHMLPKSVLFQGIWPDNGWWIQDGQPAGRTRVENFDFRRLGESHALVTFEYWQDHAGESRGRQNTAILERDDSQRHGIRWVRVHETRLPEPSDGD